MGKPLFVIVGSESSIAQDLISLILRDGYQVLSCDRREVKTSPSLVGDISSSDFVREIYSMAVQKSDDIRLAILAGVTFPHLGVYPEDLWEETFRVNATGTFLILREFHSRTEKNQISSGSIVTISSAVADRTLEDNPAYPASKLVIESLTRHYARVLGPRSISVNCVAPGYIRSGMTVGSWRDRKKRAVRSELSFLKRWGEPKEVAKFIYFLLSDKQSFLTGSVHHIDGGWRSNSGL